METGPFGSCGGAKDRTGPRTKPLARPNGRGPEDELAGAEVELARGLTDWRETRMSWPGGESAIRQAGNSLVKGNGLVKAG